MPGTFIFKPLEANLLHDTNLVSRMDPYCMFIVGGQKIKGQVCKNGGKHPIWSDTVTIPMVDEPTCLVKLKDKDLIKDDKIGRFEIDLSEIEAAGHVKKWFQIFYKDQPAGEILMEIDFTGNSIYKTTKPGSGSKVTPELMLQSTSSGSGDSTCDMSILPILGAAISHGQASNKTLTHHNMSAPAKAYVNRYEQTLGAAAVGAKK